MYVDALNQCVKCTAPCSRCALNVTQVLCYQCAAGYYWYNGQCYLQCPQSTTPIRLASTVYNNVTLTNVDTCQPCQQSNCIQCSSVSSGSTQCSSCLSPFILYNGNCVQDCGNSQLILKYNPNTLVW